MPNEITPAAAAEALRRMARDARRPVERHEDPDQLLRNLAAQLERLAAQLDQAQADQADPRDHPRAERLAGWVNDLMPQVVSLTAELASMRRQRDAALSVINKALDARRGAEAELRAIKQAMEGQSDG